MLKRGDTFRLNNGQVVVFKSAAATSGQMWFRDVLDATDEKSFIVSRQGAKLIDIVAKLSVDRLGNVRNAND